MTDEAAPARRFIDAGVPVALGTDFNPGTSPTPNLPLVMTVACLEMKLSPAEALAAVTVNAAYAVGVGDEAGSIEPGKQADLVIWRRRDRGAAALLGGRRPRGRRHQARPGGPPPRRLSRPDGPPAPPG